MFCYLQLRPIINIYTMMTKVTVQYLVMVQLHVLSQLMALPKLKNLYLEQMVVVRIT